MKNKKIQTLVIAIILLFGGYFTDKAINHGNNTTVSNVVNKFTKSNTEISSNKEEDLAKLNYQSGANPVVEINHNQSTLDPNSWHTNKVNYQDLDRLNRTSSYNIGYLENRNIASGDLRVRQYVNPTGWHQKFVDGQPIINRGHMIAYSISKGISQSGTYSASDLSGDQNNPKNLFTQTAFSNQKLQTIYESQVRNALYHHKKVIFYAHPIFRDNERMARGVHLQAISTDKSLNFNVYIHNVQPNVKFDYLTGRSTIDRSMNVPEQNS